MHQRRYVVVDSVGCIILHLQVLPEAGDELLMLLRWKSCRCGRGLRLVYPIFIFYHKKDAVQSLLQRLRFRCIPATVRGRPPDMRQHPHGPVPLILFRKPDADTVHAAML